MRARAALAGPLAAGLLLAGCGGPSADLFLVSRSGEIPDADLELVVTDGGSARCNGQGPRDMGGERLLAARAIAREAAPLAERDVDLEAGREPVLAYTVRLQEGRVRFRDTSPDLPGVLQRVQGFTREVAREVCGLKR